MRRALFALALLALLASPVWAGASRTFDGSDDTIAMGDALDFERTDTFSVAFWYKSAVTGPSAIGSIVSKQSCVSSAGYNLNERGDLGGDPLAFTLATSGSNYINILYTRPNDTAWHSVVATYSGSSAASGVKFYVDGSEATPTVIQDNLNASTIHGEAFRISGRCDTTINYYNGSVAHISVHSVVLTAVEVQEFARGLPIYRGQVGRWMLLDNGSSPTYNDYAAGNDGTASNHPSESTDGPRMFFPGGAQ